MALVRSGFETGVNGATILSTDPGDPDAWDNVTVGATGTVAYDNTRAKFGSLSGKIAAGGTAAQSFVRWDARFGTPVVTDHYWRLYLYMTALPTTAYVFIIDLAVSAICCGVTMQTDGKLRTFDNAIVTLNTFTNAVALNQWVRIEGHFVHSTTAGFVECKLFNNADSATPTETVTSGTTVNTLASADRFKVGIGTAVATVGPIWLDAITAGAAAYPGPYVASAGGQRLLVGIGS